MQKTYHSTPVFQAIPLACLVLKPVGDSFSIIDANEKGLQLVQAEASDIIGKKLKEAFPDNPHQEENGLARLSESLQKVIRTGEKDSIDVLRHDIPVRATNEYLTKYWSPENIPVLGSNGEVEVVLHVVNDVTHQVLAKEKEQKMQLQHQHFIDNNTDGLYSLDTQGNFTSANEGIANIAGVPLADLLKMDFLPFCHPDDEEEILQYFGKAISGEPIKFEAKFISGKGRNMILDISLLPMLVNGKIEGAYGIAKDITNIRKSEQIIVEKKNFLNTHASFITNLINNELENHALEEAFATVGKTVGVDRMYYFSANAGPEAGECYMNLQVEWSTETASSQRHNEELQDMKVAEVEQMLGFAGSRAPYTAFPHQMPESEMKQHLLRQGIKSILVLPIYLKDSLRGIVGFDDCTSERQWNQEEIAFLQSLAHNLATAQEKRAVQQALKEREITLIQSEKKFKALVQEGSDLISILDEHGNYKFVSESSSRVLGISPEAYLGKNAFESIHPKDKPVLLEKFHRLEKGEQTRWGPYRFKDKDNNWRWAETSITNLLHEPAVNGIVTNARDITTIQNQATEIAQINDRYRLAATATQDLMYDWDLKTDKVKRFHKTASFLGYMIKEVEERDFWRTHVHPEELEELHQHLRSVLNDPDRTFINSKYRMRRADGTYAHFMDRAYILRDSKKKAIRLVGATSDISDLTAKTASLEIANKRFEMAMKATNEMIWDWDISSDKVIRNQAVEDIYGYIDKEEPAGKDFLLNKIHADEREMVQSSLFGALENPARRKWQKEYRIIKANGEVAYVVDRGYILRDKDGKAIRMVGASLDITASRKALMRIEDQNQRLKDISWEQSHVVRAPLVRILGLLEFMQTEGSEGMSNEEVWGHIEASAKELDGIVKGIVKKTEEITVG